MLGMFCGTNATTNEQYKKYIKKRIHVLTGMFFVGVLTMVLAIVAETVWKVSMQTYLYSGFGSGLMCASIILILKNRKLLKDEEKLRQARIAASDERNLQISTSATKVAIAALLIGMYCVILIGGLWYPVLAQTMGFLVCLFLLVYIAAYRLVSKRI